ncbi:MAG: methyltransferase family protein [Solirubrobacteraceae bacterium]
MKPYFQNHSAGWLFLIVLICFFGMEIIQFFRQLQWRKDATRISTPAFWVAVVIWVIFATVILHRAGTWFSGAAIEHPQLVFVVGMVLFAAGAGLRWWSFWALGQYFTFTVDVSRDQQVVTQGPYRVLRHPGYVGGLLALIGLGVIYSNWVGLAGFACSALVIVLWRIHIEETALLRTAGEPYRLYAAHHKRLIPLIW